MPPTRTIVRMPKLSRPDGAEIEWRLDGERGPIVAIAPMALHPPVALRGIVEELAGDHRVLTYDLRGMGGSSRTPPYTLETDADDLAALLEAAGGDALLIALGDGVRRGVKAAAARPDLVHTVVTSGEQPLASTRTARSRGSLADSPAVLDALVQLLETDYRAGLRTMFESSGEQGWEERALHERIDAIGAHCPQESAVARLREWISDDSRELARALGDRLWFLHFPGNAWFRGSLDAIKRDLPDAHYERVSDGVINRPAENARVIRQILTAPRARA